MKSILPILLLSVFFFNSYSLLAQEVSISHIGSSSDVTVNQDGISLGWTIGQIYGGTSLKDHHITAGFHQGAYAAKNKSEPQINSNPLSTKLDKSPKVEVSASLYPNPTTRYINLEFDGLLQDPIVLRLFDLTGNLVLQKKLDTDQSTQFQVYEIEHLPSGTYFLNFDHNQINIPSKKLSKI